MEKKAWIPRTVGDGLLLLALVLSLVFFLYKGLIPMPGQDNDGKVVYATGYCLNHGISPYDLTAWTSGYHQAIGVDPLPHLMFAYLPTSFPIYQVLSLVPLAAALWLIKLIDLAAFIITLVGLVKILKLVKPEISPRHIQLTLFIATLSTAPTYSMFLGQLTVPIIAALCWALYFFLKKQTLPAVLLVALFFTIKPQIALVPGAALLFLFTPPRVWLTTFACVLAVILGLVFGYQIDTAQFLNVLSVYGASWANGPTMTAGLTHLLEPFVGLSSVAALAIAGLLTVALALYFKAAKGLKPESWGQGYPVFAVFLVLLINETVSSLHHYDHFVIVLTTTLVMLLPWLEALLLMPGLVVALVPGPLHNLFGAAFTPESVITGALFWELAVGIGILFFLQNRPSVPAPQGILQVVRWIKDAPTRQEQPDVQKI